MAIVVKLDDMLHARRMTLTELSEQIGITLANLSILKTGKARAIRFSTLDAICEALRCQPGDLLEFRQRDDSGRGHEEAQCVRVVHRYTAEISAAHAQHARWRHRVEGENPLGDAPVQLARSGGPVGAICNSAFGIDRRESERRSRGLRALHDRNGLPDGDDGSDV